MAFLGFILDKLFLNKLSRGLILFNAAADPGISLSFNLYFPFILFATEVEHKGVTKS